MTESPAASVAGHIRRLGRACVEAARAGTGSLPRTPYDPEWPSPCVVDIDDDRQRCTWQPVLMPQPPAFGRLANALDGPIHEDLVQLYGTAWSAPLPVQFEDNPFALLQLWSEADFEHLLSNLIGHALEKKRVRQPLSLFFGLVDDERLLSIDNASGEVYLESLRTRRPTLLAPGLDAFLAQVQAAPVSDGPPG